MLAPPMRLAGGVHLRADWDIEQTHEAAWQALLTPFRDGTPLVTAYNLASATLFRCQGLYHRDGDFAHMA